MTENAEIEAEYETLAPEAVGLMTARLATAGRALVDLERTMFGLGMILEDDESDELVTATPDMNPGFAERVRVLKNEVYDLYAYKFLPLIPGYAEEKGKVDRMVEEVKHGR